jgi:hypothetical protein
MNHDARRLYIADACIATEVHADGDIARARRRHDIGGQRVELDHRMDAVEGLVTLPVVLAGELREFSGLLRELAGVADLQDHFAVNGVDVCEIKDGEFDVNAAVGAEREDFLGDGFAGGVRGVDLHHFDGREAEGQFRARGIECLV